MKIVFWSNVRGQCGTTLHLTCIAAIQAIFDNERVVLMENHDHLVNIETCLVKPNIENMVKEDRSGYDVFGLERLIERFGNIEPTAEESLIRRCAKIFAGDKLYYLPHGYLRNKELLDYEFSRNFIKVFNGLERHFNTVYIDTFATESLSTRTIIDTADIVVVNLNQNKNVLEHFFRNFSSLRNKAIYIIGNYYPGGHNNIMEIKRRYQIPDDKIFAIPFCMEAAESESEGSLANFIARNYLEPSIDNRDFIRALHEAYEGVRNYSLSLSSSKARGLSFM